MWLQICKSCWSKDTWKSAQKWKTIQLLLMKLKIRKSCWSKDTWKSRPKWKPFRCSYPQRMTFWSEKAWRITQILLAKYASLTWQSTAWRADQMLSFLNLLCFGASCCCLLCVVYKYCWAIWICFSQMFHMLLQTILKKSPVWVHPCFQTLDVEHL